MEKRPILKMRINSTVFRYITDWDFAIILFAIILLVLTILLFIWTGHVAAQKSKPTFRFDLIYHEGNTNNFEVFHDKETGQEFICHYGGAVQTEPSCWLTGRKW